MGRINRAPLGLLDLLQSKTDGVNPSQLAESVAPTLEMSPFYLSDKLGHAFSTVSTSVIGNTADIDVSEGQIFALFAMDVNFIGNVIGAFASFEVEIQGIPTAFSPLSGFGVFSTDVMDAPLVGDRATRAVVFDRTIFMPPGSKLQTTVLTRSGTFNATTNIGMYRLSV